MTGATPARAGVEVPERMTVIEIAEPGGPEVLRSAHRPVPIPRKGEILVRVVAAGVNRPDANQREGRYPPPAGVTDVPGLELAGRVVAVDAGADRFAPGEQVCALVAGGGYAEYAVVPEPQALPIPEGLDAIAAAAIPETFFTVWDNLFERGRLTSGERLLLHGGAGGIGTTAIQLAAARGATVWATAGGAERAAACERLGAARGIDHRTEEWPAVVREETGGEGVDVILDVLGGEHVQQHLELLRIEGRLVQVSLLAGRSAAIDLWTVMSRRLTIAGSTLRARSVEEKGRIARALEREVWPLLSEGRVAPAIDSTFPLEAAADAHRRLESREHVGKIVLVVEPDGA